MSLPKNITIQMINKIDIGDIYINNLSHFYDDNELMKNMKKQINDPLFEDVLVEIGRIIMEKKLKPSEKRDFNNQIKTTIKDEFNSMYFKDYKNKMKIISNKNFDDILALVKSNRPEN